MHRIQCKTNKNSSYICYWFFKKKIISYKKNGNNFGLFRNTHDSRMHQTSKRKKMITFHYTGGLKIIIIITNNIIIIIQLITNILLTMISSLSSLFWIIQPKIDLSSTHKMYYELILSSQLKLLYNNKDDDDNNSYGFFPLL